MGERVVPTVRKLIKAAKAKPAERVIEPNNPEKQGGQGPRT